MEDSILKGTIDLHFHAGPDVRERKLTYLEAAFQARNAGMKAILIKSHFTPTAEIASLIQPLVRGILVFGGIAMNDPLGGLNPAAVETALKMGARQIWMPTLSAANQYRYEGKKGGISILTAKGDLKKEAKEILEIVYRENTILSTGHLSSKEVMVLVKETRKRGVQKILITHPDHHVIKMHLEIQKELAAQGVFFDRCFPRKATCVLSMKEMAQRIREVGVRSTILTSDLGQIESPFPTEGLKSYIEQLIQLDFSEEEIDQMVRINPERLLDLS